VTCVGKLLQVNSHCEHTAVPTRVRSQMCVMYVVRHSTSLITYAFTNGHILVNVHTVVMNVGRALHNCLPSPSTNVTTQD